MSARIAKVLAFLFASLENNDYLCTRYKFSEFIMYNVSNHFTTNNPPCEA